ncbi:hypothetical protein [Noviherbaspirillum denitrificans]|uniref:Virulence factor n=1 Tax=Noviherbaspirillum denitrificans TaxID=1968433 RepID=A0A254THG4_9BURK|nr:hypothetical protein [Noviherbaspirillum denitrificans]OWW22054.1 hypothetical protein AYR66_23740 [Noviherbaspirillum denitrificans]
MKQFAPSSPAKWIAVAAVVLAAPMAGASDVDWSVTVGSGYPAARVYTPPPPVVYVQPEPVYVRPRPVYVQPRPVYVQPATVVQYGPPAYYVEPGRPHKHKHKHWKHRHDDRYYDRYDY